MAPPFATRRVCQVALVVRDIEARAQHFADAFGLPVPEIRLTDPAEQSHARYQGQSTNARAKLAFFEMENLQIELIEPVGGPSVWQTFLDTHGEGVQHIAFHVGEMEPTLANCKQAGIGVEQTGDFPGGCYAYLDTENTLGVTLELLGRHVEPKQP